MPEKRRDILGFASGVACGRYTSRVYFFQPERRRRAECLRRMTVRPL